MPTVIPKECDDRVVALAELIELVQQDPDLLVHVGHRCPVLAPPRAHAGVVEVGQRRARPNPSAGLHVGERLQEVVHRLVEGDGGGGGWVVGGGRQWNAINGGVGVQDALGYPPLHVRLAKTRRNEERRAIVVHLGGDVAQLLEGHLCGLRVVEERWIAAGVVDAAADRALGTAGFRGVHPAGPRAVRHARVPRVVEVPVGRQVRVIYLAGTDGGPASLEKELWQGSPPLATARCRRLPEGVAELPGARRVWATPRKEGVPARCAEGLLHVRPREDDRLAGELLQPRGGDGSAIRRVASRVELRSEIVGDKQQHARPLRSAVRRVGRTAASADREQKHGQGVARAHHCAAAPGGGQYCSCLASYPGRGPKWRTARGSTDPSQPLTPNHCPSGFPVVLRRQRQAHPAMHLQRKRATCKLVFFFFSMRCITSA
eukprot:COSAG01_NODE_1799_length_9205_cov_130.191302_9_plen_431_part_00